MLLFKLGCLNMRVAPILISICCLTVSWFNHAVEDTEVITVQGTRLGINTAFIEEMMAINAIELRQQHLNYTLSLNRDIVYDPGRSGQDTQCAPQEGNPVLIATGVKVETVNDIVSYGQHPLVLTRHYSSGASYFQPGMGMGWRLNHQVHLDTQGEHITAYYPTSRLSFTQVQYDVDLPGYATPKTVAYSQDGRNVIFAALNNTRWVMHREDDVTEIYNAQGQLLRRVFSRFPVHFAQDGSMVSQGVHHDYQYAGRALQSVMHSNADTLIFEWTNERITRVIGPNQVTVSYAFDDNAELSQVTGLDGNTIRYHYEQYYAYMLTGQSLNGQRIAHYTYDERSRRYSASEHLDGHYRYRFSYHWKGTQQTTTVTNPLGHEVTHTFDNINGIQRRIKISQNSSINCPQASAHSTYNAKGQLTRQTDWRGTHTDYHYDSQGILVSKVLASGTSDARTEYFVIEELDKTQGTSRYTHITPTLTQMTEYNGYGHMTQRQVTSETHTLQTIYTNTYQANGLMTEQHIAYPNGTSVTRIYGPKGYLSQRQDSVNGTTEYRNYTALGLPQTIVYPYGMTEQLRYDDNGRILYRARVPSALMTDSGDAAPEFGQSVAYGYNARGRLISATPSHGQAVTHAYDKNGLRTLSEYQHRNERYRTRYQYDRLGNMTQIQHFDPDAPKQVCHYEWETGESFCYTDMQPVLRYEQHFEYASNGRLYRVKDHDDNVLAMYHYDANGNRVTFTDGHHHATTYRYNRHDELIGYTDGNGDAVKINHSDAGVTMMTDANGNATHYARNGLGLAQRIHSPDASQSDYFYHPNGQLAEHIDANGNSTSYDYDAGQLTHIHTPTHRHTLSYDTFGRLTYASTGEVTLAYQYNATGQLASQTLRQGYARYTTQWGYDAQQRLSSLTYPSGHRLQYDYQDNGQLAKISVTYNGKTQTVIDGITQSPNGPLRQFRYGNQLMQNFAYDKQHRLTFIGVSGKASSGNSHTLQHDSLVYDANAQIVQIDDGVDSRQDQTFAYDDAGRLRLASSTSYGVKKYQYDANGNRTALMGTRKARYVYASDSNRLTQITQYGRTRRLTHDENGDLISDTPAFGATRQYQYNAQNQLTASQSGSQSTQYRYDPRGYRFSKARASHATKYFNYSPDGVLLSESGNKIYIYFAGRVVAMMHGSQLYFVHSDHLGRPERITDQQQTTQWQAKLMPFDRSVIYASSAIEEFNLGFPGQYYDKESGLWYNIHRYYDASTGRYITSDPIGLAGGMNTYVYAIGNPVLFTDPRGLVVKLCSNELNAGPPISPDTINPLRHDFLVINGQSFGFYPKTDSYSNLIYGQGRISSDDELNSKCKTLVEDNSKDKQVLNAIEKVGKPQYSVLAAGYPSKLSIGLMISGARNCQSWVSDVLIEAKINQ